MKFIPIFGLLCLIVSPTYADLLIYEYNCMDEEGIGFQAYGIDFGDVSLGEPGISDPDVTICLRIINAGTDPVEDIVPSISGNSSEFGYDSSCAIPSLNSGDYCFIDITFNPEAHFGKRNRKFTVDAIEVVTAADESTALNEISTTIPMVGTSFNPLKP